MTSRPTKDSLYPRGPSWAFFIFATITTFATGIVTGMIVDGSLEIINAYRMNTQHRTSLASAPVSESQLVEDNGNTQASQAEPKDQWFPENNKVDWALSIRADQILLGLTIHNESNDLNRRVLLQRRAGNAYALAATLFVRAKQTATIKIPSGEYRVDVATSPTKMHWDAAQQQRAVPSYALRMEEPYPDEDPAFATIYIEDNGRVSSK